MLQHRKKKKGLSKKIRSMYEIQSNVLSSKEKKKRDRNLKKEIGKKVVLSEERIVNLSL